MERKSPAMGLTEPSFTHRFPGRRLIYLPSFQKTEFGNTSIDSSRSNTLTEAKQKMLRILDGTEKGARGVLNQARGTHHY